MEVAYKYIIKYKNNIIVLVVKMQVDSNTRLISMDFNEIKVKEKSRNNAQIKEKAGEKRGGSK